MKGLQIHTLECRPVGYVPGSYTDCHGRDHCPIERNGYFCEAKEQARKCKLRLNQPDTKALEYFAKNPVPRDNLRVWAYDLTFEAYQSHVYPVIDAYSVLERCKRDFDKSNRGTLSRTKEIYHWVFKHTFKMNSDSGCERYLNQGGVSQTQCRPTSFISKQETSRDKTFEVAPMSRGSDPSGHGNKDEARFGATFENGGLPFVRDAAIEQCSGRLFGAASQYRVVCDEVSGSYATFRKKELASALRALDKIWIESPRQALQYLLFYSNFSSGKHGQFQLLAHGLKRRFQRIFARKPFSTHCVYIGEPRYLGVTDDICRQTLIAMREAEPRHFPRYVTSVARAADKPAFVFDLSLYYDFQLFKGRAAVTHNGGVYLIECEPF